MKKKSIKNTIRGGQVILHNLRMIAQVLQKAALWLLPVGLLAAVNLVFSDHPIPEDRSIGRQWLLAELNLLFKNSHFQQTFVFPSGQTMKATVGQILAAPFVQESCRPIAGGGLR